MSWESKNIVRRYRRLIIGKGTIEVGTIIVGHLSLDRSWGDWCHSSCWSCSWGRGSGGCSGGGGVTIDRCLGGSLWALSRDVTSLAAAVAGLSGSVQGSAVRSGAVAGDVT